tara:strand:+ start:491 stop:895 length:405 start_codon:yes stop_codon:yes gene_type:complete
MNESEITKLNAREGLNKYLETYDEETGEIIINPFNLDETLIKFIRALLDPSIDDLKKMINIKCNYPARRGFAWDRSEESKLIASYKSGINFKKIAEIHQRSYTAILARLKKLDLIDDYIEYPSYNNKERFSVYL